jgi:methanol--5-hydroxybenzimidazolylcobamide Co-methyltransferase
VIVEAGPRFTSIAISEESGLVYGTSPLPLACGLGLTIGAGTVFPEVNFTLPPMSITAESWAM